MVGFCEETKADGGMGSRDCEGMPASAEVCTHEPDAFFSFRDRRRWFGSVTAQSRVKQTARHDQTKNFALSQAKVSLAKKKKKNTPLSENY